MAIKIVVDPGHYDKYNPGAAPGYYEGQQMFILGNHLAQELRNRGADVTVTRAYIDDNPSLEARGAMVNGADLFISLHSDATGEPINPNVRGVTVYYSVRQPGARAFADDLGQAVAAVMDTPFLGSKTRLYPGTTDLDYNAVIRSAVAHGAKNAFLVEHSFHTNPRDAATLMDDAKLRQIAAAEADVIARHLGLTPPVSGGISYTVRAGDSLYSIAEKFGIPWQRIAEANGISPPYTLRIGQTLAIPVNIAQHTVRAGETLYSIGSIYGVPWSTIALINGISAPYTLQVGQTLVIPTSTIVYIVQAGDTLYSIGTRFGVPWQRIAEANNLLPPYTLFIGQVLRIV